MSAEEVAVVDMAAGIAAVAVVVQLPVEIAVHQVGEAVVDAGEEAVVAVLEIRNSAKMAVSHPLLPSEKTSNLHSEMKPTRRKVPPNSRLPRESGFLSQ